IGPDRAPGLGGRDVGWKRARLRIKHGGHGVTIWNSKVDFGVVHPLVYLECRTGEGPILETLKTIVDDCDFGAVEIAPPKDPTSEAAALAKQVDRSNFGLTIDLSHLPLLGETSQQALHTAAPYLSHAHIGNCVVNYPDSPLYGDFHPRFGHPLGCSDLPEVI